MSEAISVQGNNGKTLSRQAQRAVVPPVDVLENDNELLIIADVPGISGNAIDLRVENDMLTLEAHRSEGATDSIRALGREYEEVNFVRNFRIPAGIDAPNISAEAKNGTLVVRLPKAAAARPRKIEVRPA